LYDDSLALSTKYYDERMMLKSLVLETFSNLLTTYITTDLLTKGKGAGYQKKQTATNL